MILVSALEKRFTESHVRVLPCPSITKKYTTAAAKKRQPAKTYPKRKSIAPTMKGVKKARRKFHSQFEAVDIAMALERYRDGYSSAQIVQTMGPQVEANPRINRQAKTIMAVPECGVA